MRIGDLESQTGEPLTRDQNQRSVYLPDVAGQEFDILPELEESGTFKDGQDYVIVWIQLRDERHTYRKLLVNKNEALAQLMAFREKAPGERMESVTAWKVKPSPDRFARWEFADWERFQRESRPHVIRDAQ